VRLLAPDGSPDGDARSYASRRHASEHDHHP
jgi:hypothetical protein